MSNINIDFNLNEKIHITKKEKKKISDTLILDKLNINYEVYNLLKLIQNKKNNDKLNDDYLVLIYHGLCLNIINYNKFILLDNIKFNFSKNIKLDYIRISYLSLIFNILVNYYIDIININIYYNNLYNDFKQLFELSISIEYDIFDNIKTNEQLDINILEDNENIFVDFVKIYRIMINKITKNLDYESEVNNYYLISKIINHNRTQLQFNFEEIKNLYLKSSYELCPIKSENTIKIINSRINQTHNAKISKAYVCGKCKKRETITKQVQLRSLDESSNTQITCINCNHIWVI